MKKFAILLVLPLALLVNACPRESAPTNMPPPEQDRLTARSKEQLSAYAKFRFRATTEPEPSSAAQPAVLPVQ